MDFTYKMDLFPLGEHVVDVIFQMHHIYDEITSIKKDGVDIYDMVYAHPTAMEKLQKFIDDREFVDNDD